MISAGAVPSSVRRLPRGPSPNLALVAVSSSAMRDQREMALFYLDRGRRLIAQDNDREAEAELKRALYLSPYEAEAHLLLGRICLRSGRIREAIESFKISLWSQETAAAHVALGEAYLETHSPDLARGEAERALVMEPGVEAARQLLDRIKRAPAPAG